jgi:radical SAM/Cys-rich protein
MSFAPTPNLQTGRFNLSFERRLHQEGAQLKRMSLDIVQINLGKLCNQACAHCHVEAGPGRKEVMSRQMAGQVVDFVGAAGAATVDITGGAPELNPSFRHLVGEFHGLGLHVIVRSNLSVLLQPGLEDLAEFLAAHGVEITASLPCYTEENVDRQRGQGVFAKSILAFRRLNKLGYGLPGSGLTLNLVYNPGGAFLPAAQAALEADYKHELGSRFGLSFNHLYTIANMPIGRFARQLKFNGEAGSYRRLLASSFNPDTLENLMCLRQVSIAWDGFLNDCDFNQMLGLRLGEGGSLRLGELPAAEIVRRLRGRPIRTGFHCYGCTASSGSSCAGSLVS